MMRDERDERDDPEISRINIIMYTTTIYHKLRKKSTIFYSVYNSYSKPETPYYKAWYKF